MATLNAYTYTTRKSVLVRTNVSRQWQAVAHLLAHCAYTRVCMCVCTYTTHAGAFSAHVIRCVVTGHADAC